MQMRCVFIRVPQSCPQQKRVAEVWMPLQMLSKAEEATAQVQQLLEKSLEKWLPNWMEKRYEKVSFRQLQPVRTVLKDPVCLMHYSVAI